MAKPDSEDLKAIKDLVEVTIDEKLDEKLDAKMKYLPTKDEFYGKMDEVLGELKTIREEQALQSQYLSDHDTELIRSRIIWAYLQTSLVFPSTLY